jgi:cytoskeletal protein CcmA (bactofilin family)
MGKPTESISIINEGLTIEGTVECRGRMIVNGTIQGKVIGDDIVIGRTGTITSPEAAAENVTVGGAFEGDLHAKRELIILATGTCGGKVRCRNLVVEPGGVLNAEITRITDSAPGGPAADIPPKKRPEIKETPTTQT